MQLREEQFASLRKQFLGDGLIKSFEGSKQVASRDPQTGDILVKDPKGNTNRLTFDEKGFVGGVTSPLGRRWRLENDRQGRLLGLTNPAGPRLGMKRNVQGDVSVVSRDSRVLFNMTYDSQGRLAQVAYPDQTATLIEYETTGNVSAITDRLGIKEIYEYDLDGDLISITDGNKNRATFKYGTWHSPESVHYADGSSESYEYDPAGLVRRIAKGSELVAETGYDDNGRPIRIAFGDGDVLRFKYDDKGNVVEARNAQTVVRYEYDDEGRVLQEDQDGQIIKYHCDESGMLIGLTYPSGEKVEFDYDEDLRLASVKDWNKGLYSFSYAVDDRGIKLRSPNGLTASITQSKVGLPESIVVSKGDSKGNELFSFNYQYDDEDRVKIFTDSDFGVRKYTYDVKNQLLSISSDQPDKGEEFAYDGAGNRVRSNGDEATFNVLNQLMSQGKTRCNYDARGNVVSSTAPDDAWRFTYNSRNLLVRAEDRNSRVVTFGYDAFGRRIWKLTGTTVTRYIWLGEQLIREVTSEGSRTSVQDYLYYPRSYTPLATRVNEEVYYYHTDHLGTPRRITNSHGKVAWSADYNGFGQALIKVNGLSNRLRFPGQYFDEETGLHYNRFRYYSPALGRYLSRDPVTYLSGLNFYVYAGNDPINSADPMGLWTWEGLLTGIAKGAAIVGAAAAGIAVGIVTAPVLGPGAIVAGAAVAGAIGFGLNEYIDQKEFSLTCIFKEAARGAGIGAIAALPFVFLPATAGVAAFMGIGGVSGAIGYIADWATNPAAMWSWEGFLLSVGIGVATAGLARYFGPSILRWVQARGIKLPPQMAAELEREAAARAAQPKIPPAKVLPPPAEVPPTVKAPSPPVEPPPPTPRTFQNQLPELLPEELATAARVGAKPTTLGGPGFDKTINEGTIKFVVVEGPELIVGPHSVAGEEISHAVLSGGRPVLSAGQADIAGSKGNYVGLGITEHSGHFMPTKESLEVARKLFAAFGITFP